MHCTKKSHKDAELSVVRYIKDKPGLGLLIPAMNNNQLSAYCDSDWGAYLKNRRSVIAPIQTASNTILHDRTKHINIYWHFVREIISQGMIRKNHVSTIEKQADILTKGLGRVQHE